ncbi:MAG TPA: iron-sulfur cluster assembly protein [Opitutaceae bacterium]|nr:iron-sulfur cluster assembly protein [Opitutaceae bacterium]
MTQETTLTQDTPATLIPAGDAVTLKAGTAVYVAQTLGGNVTVRTDRGLFRIAREHAGAVAGLDLEDEAAAPAARAEEFGEDAVWSVLKTCFDPEIPVNIVDLGLIYDLAIEKTPAGGHAVEVKMTLTAPGCGMGPVIAEDARKKIAALPTVESAKVHIVWDPQWTPQMISDVGRKTLGLE